MLACMEIGKGLLCAKLQLCRRTLETVGEWLPRVLIPLPLSGHNQVGFLSLGCQELFLGIR